MAWTNRITGNAIQSTNCRWRRQQKARGKKWLYECDVGAQHIASDVIAAPLEPNCAKVLTLLHPATFCQNVRNFHQHCAKAYVHIVNTDYIINRAPLHGQISTVGLRESPELLIIASYNIIFYLISLSNIGRTWKFCSTSHAHCLFWLDK